MVVKPRIVHNLYRNFFVVFSMVLFLLLACFLLSHLIPSSFYDRSSVTHHPVSLQNLNHAPEFVVTDDATVSAPRNPRCSYWDCFNVYRCGNKGTNKILVYIYPIQKFVDGQGIPIGGMISQEMYSILETILESRYYTPNPSQACILVPSIDTLNQNRFRPKQTSQALRSLPFWNNGENHLIWNMVPGAPPDYSTVVELELGKAMVAGAGLSSWTYRQSFDLSLPIFSPLASLLDGSHAHPFYSRSWLLLSAQTNIHGEYLTELQALTRESTQTLLLEQCPQGNYSVRCSSGGTRDMYLYPQILQAATFCLVIRGARLAQPILLESLAAGCIPVIVADSLIMPFQEVLDWKRAAVFISEVELSDLLDTLRSISDERVREMQKNGIFLYRNYFSSIKKITNTALDILNQRVFPQHSKSYEEWNVPPNPLAAHSPLFLQLTAPRWQGFTAVVLTYDRVESLFTLIKQLAKVPSLSKILVVWNNQRKSPPHASIWPKVNKPLKVIQTKANKLSNRFYPYPEIETEAILTIDDDIVMLTSDELEFGYEVWREFPDRIVGFPSRTHKWDNISGSWKYESEWTNNISMVLTGAAFHHKYWSYMYTTAMPGDIKDWVDSHMNCEDIAMNFLVANITNKAPIKVTPRKKFKCPECTNNEMLSLDLNHMVERTLCINRFASIYGSMPLKTVEFRADPVLFKDNFPEKLKRFNDIGSL
ncbi:Exostosin-2 [Frankliniella fusca]|uniref:Exostosin-2 n=1 Tax=Frankliniella fusca TaxID=407009 RepID=A0AAE1HS57_9NEOP|nr:Exostosin-2 [Frankliniella fusca]